MSKVHIYGGGTFSYVRNHMALCAPAFGSTAKRLNQLLLLNSELHLTKMVNSNSDLVTNDDIKRHVLNVLDDSEVKVIVMNAALCDYDGKIGSVESGKLTPRLESRFGNQSMTLTPSDKVISLIKDKRPDVRVVGFKTTVNEGDASVIEYKAKRMNVDMVFANDVQLMRNCIFDFIDGSISNHYGNRDNGIIELANIIDSWVEDNSPIKNIQHFDSTTRYAVEVTKSNGRAHAFNVACEKLKACGVYGDYIDGQWARHHQWIYYVSLRK